MRSSPRTSIPHGSKTWTVPTPSPTGLGAGLWATEMGVHTSLLPLSPSSPHQHSSQPSPDSPSPTFPRGTGPSSWVAGPCTAMTAKPQLPPTPPHPLPAACLPPSLPPCGSHMTSSPPSPGLQTSHAVWMQRLPPAPTGRGTLKGGLRTREPPPPRTPPGTALTGPHADLRLELPPAPPLIAATLGEPLLPPGAWVYVGRQENDVSRAGKRGAPVLPGPR